MVSLKSTIKKIAHVVILAGLYYAAARIGLLFAIPPGFATPLWPPSGISAVYLFIFGAELWPGVFLGSFLANLHEFEGLQSFLVPTVVATGSTLYLSWVVKILKQRIDLKNFLVFSKSTFWASMWVGPIAALLSSVWGTATLLFFEKIRWSNIPFTWLNWWLGDMTGVLVFLPLCLLGVKEYRNFRGQLIKLVIIPLLISILLSLCVFLFSQRHTSNVGPLNSWFILVFSLAITGLLEVLLLSIVLRNFHIEAVVSEKTLHLQEINQQLQSALRAKSEFLANVSHEVRNPLNSILGMTQLLSETPLNQEQRKYLEIFERSGSTLLGLINDILDWSKLESNKTEISKEPMNLRELLAEVEDLFRRQADAKGLQFRFTVTSDVPLSCLGDSPRIKQILMNLLSNAIKFTEKGHIELRLSRNKTAMPGNLLFEVEDTGIGINETQSKLLFNIFTQADASITKRFGGTGLGLAICKKLIELMNGEIAVKSELGKGSLFYFTLDLPAFGGAIKSSLPIEQKAQDHTDKKWKVLLVDDSEENRILVRMFLKNYQFEIAEAENGKVALERLSTETFQMIIMDLQMPVMDGVTATRLIRQWETELNRKPTIIIALTAYTTEEERSKALKAGFDEYLTKPIVKLKLIECLDSFLQTSHSQSLPNVAHESA